MFFHDLVAGGFQNPRKRRPLVGNRGHTGGAWGHPLRIRPWSDSDGVSMVGFSGRPFTKSHFSPHIFGDFFQICFPSGGGGAWGGTNSSLKKPGLISRSRRRYTQSPRNGHFFESRFQDFMTSHEHESAKKCYFFEGGVSRLLLLAL